MWSQILVEIDTGAHLWMNVVGWCFIFTLMRKDDSEAIKTYIHWGFTCSSLTGVTLPNLPNWILVSDTETEDFLNVKVLFVI